MNLELFWNNVLLPSEPKIAEDGFYHFVYATRNLVNNKIYIGRRQSKNPAIDPYIGSGKRLKQGVIKYGRENFKRIDLFFYNDLKEADLYEDELIAYLLNEECNGSWSEFVKYCYNMRRNFGGANKYSPETKARLVYSQKKFYADNPEAREAQRANGVIGATKGYEASQTPEAKAKWLVSCNSPETKAKWLAACNSTESKAKQRWAIIKRKFKAIGIDFKVIAGEPLEPEKAKPCPMMPPKPIPTKSEKIKPVKVVAPKRPRNCHFISVGTNLIDGSLLVLMGAKDIKALGWVPAGVYNAVRGDKGCWNYKGYSWQGMSNREDLLNLQGLDKSAKAKIDLFLG